MVDPRDGLPAKDLEQGTALGEAVRGRWRVLPRPLDIVIARAEASQALPQTFQAIARGTLHGLVAYEPSREPLSTLRQELFSMALMLIAGAPSRRRSRELELRSHPAPSRRAVSRR
jgi:hypothetical protein